MNRNYSAFIQVALIISATAFLFACSPCRTYPSDSHARKECIIRVDEAAATLKPCLEHDPGSDIERACVTSIPNCPQAAQPTGTN